MGRCSSCGQDEGECTPECVWERRKKQNRERARKRRARNRSLQADLARVTPVYEAAVAWARAEGGIKWTPESQHLHEVTLRCAAAVEKAEAEEGQGWTTVW